MTVLMIELGFIPPSEYNKIVNDQKEKEMKEKEERRKRKEERKKKEEEMEGKRTIENEMEGKRTKQIENSTEQGPLSKKDEELLSSSSLSTTRSKEPCSLSNQTKNESLITDLSLRNSKNEYRFLEDSILNPACSIPSTARSIYQPNSTFSYERVFFPVPKSFIFSSTVFFFYGSSEWKLKNIQKIIEKGGFWYFTSFLIIKY